MANVDLTQREFRNNNAVETRREPRTLINGAQPFARFRTFGLQLGLAIVGLSVATLAATALAFKGHTSWLLSMGTLGADLLLILAANRKWLLFFDDQIVETDFLGPRAIAYADIRKVGGQHYGLQVQSEDRTIILTFDSLITPSAWVRVANLLGKVAPGAEFDPAAVRMRDGYIDAQWRIIPLYWAAAMIIAVVIAVIGFGG